MRAVRVNEINVTLRKAFIYKAFALESEKESKYDETTLFWDYPRIVNVPVKH